MGPIDANDALQNTECWVRVLREVESSLGPSPDSLPTLDADIVRQENRQRLWMLQARPMELKLLSQEPVSTAFFFDRFAENAREMLGANAAVLWSPTIEGAIISHSAFGSRPTAEIQSDQRERIVNQTLKTRRMYFITVSPPSHDESSVVHDWSERLGECRNSVEMVIAKDASVDASLIVSPIVSHERSHGALEVQIPHRFVYPTAGPSMAPALIRRTKGLAETAAEFLMNRRR